MKPSNNFIILDRLIEGPEEVSYLKSITKSFYKRIGELRKWGCKFEYIDEYIILTHLPKNLRLNYMKGRIYFNKEKPLTFFQKIKKFFCD